MDNVVKHLSMLNHQQSFVSVFWVLKHVFLSRRRAKQNFQSQQNIVKDNNNDVVQNENNNVETNHL